MYPKLSLGFNQPQQTRTSPKKWTLSIRQSTGCITCLVFGRAIFVPRFLILYPKGNLFAMKFLKPLYDYIHINGPPIELLICSS